MYMEMARLRPSSAGLTRSSASSSPSTLAQRTRTASLKTWSPAATVTDRDPPNRTRVFDPATVAPENDCSPMLTLPNVTGPVPHLFERRTRMTLPQMSGLTITRRVWLLACGRAGAVNGKAKFTSAAVCVVPTPLNVFCGAVIQVATHLVSHPFSWSRPSARPAIASSATAPLRTNVSLSMQGSSLRESEPAYATWVGGSRSAESFRGLLPRGG